MLSSLRGALSRAAPHLESLRQDAARLTSIAQAAGHPHPKWRALADTSLPVLTLIRAGAALRAAFGSSFGVNHLLSWVFHVDVWTDVIGGGLRLPHPFQIVIGEGVAVGSDCTLMHGVTIQRGLGTTVADRAVLGTGAVILSGSSVGEGAVVGANSVVRGTIPAHAVAVGAPARVVRALAQGEPS